VAYLVLLLVIGLPLVFLEIGLGQFCQQGSLQIYRAVPLLKGFYLVFRANHELILLVNVEQEWDLSNC